MELPPGHSKKRNEKFACCWRAYTGSNKLWDSDMLNSHSLSSSFNKFGADYSFFIKSNGKSLITLLIYIDNIIVADNDENIINKLIRKLDSEFNIKDLRF